MLSHRESLIGRKRSGRNGRFGRQSGRSVSSSGNALELQDSSCRSRRVKRPWLAELRALSAISTAQDRLPGRKLLLWIGADISTNPLPTYKLDGKGRKDIFGKMYWFSTLLRQAGVSLAVFSLEDNTNKTDHRQNESWRSLVTGVPTAQEVTWSSLDKRVLAVQSGGWVFPPSKDLVPQLNDSLHEQGSSYYELTFDRRSQRRRMNTMRSK